MRAGFVGAGEEDVAGSLCIRRIGVLGRDSELVVSTVKVAGILPDRVVGSAAEGE